MAERFVDAALSNADGSHEATFFLGDQFVTYNYDRDRVNDGVHPVSDLGFPAGFTPSGVGASLDAALKGRKQFTDTGYCFRGTNYGRLALDVRAGDPNLGALSAWGLPAPLDAGVEAAFNGRAPTRDGKGYFFRGSQYVRYDWAQDHPDPDFPKQIGTMVGMVAPFSLGIDAAVDGEGAFASFGYLFREDRYLRFAWDPAGGGEPRVDGAPASIQGNWTGLAELLLAGAAKTQALAWTDAAMARLSAFLVAGSGGAPFPFDAAVFDAALASHFHVDPGAAPSVRAAAVSQILVTFSNVSTTLRQSATVFRYRTDAEATGVDGNPSVPDAYAFFGGTINVTGGFVSRGPLNRAASVLHESVHVVDDLGGSSTTHIPEWYVTDPVADSLGLSHQPDTADFATRYDLMPAADAQHNPSSYAAFAQHVALGADTRFGAGRPDQ